MSIVGTAGCVGVIGMVGLLRGMVGKGPVKRVLQIVKGRVFASSLLFPTLLLLVIEVGIAHHHKFGNVRLLTLPAITCFVGWRGIRARAGQKSGIAYQRHRGKM